MTTQAMAALPVRTVRDVLPAGLSGVAAPYLAALAWSLLASAIWGAGPRVAAFVDPSAPRPTGYLATSLLFGIVLSAACMNPVSLRQPVLLLFIASSALGFRFGARR
jgi:hypothetical protein